MDCIDFVIGSFVSTNLFSVKNASECQTEASSVLAQ